MGNMEKVHGDSPFDAIRTRIASMEQSLAGSALSSEQRKLLENMIGMLDNGLKPVKGVPNDGLNALLEEIPHSVFVVAADGSLEYANPHFLNCIQAVAADLAGYGWHALVHPDQADQFLETFFQSVDDGKAFVGECALKVSGGAFLVHRTRAVPLTDMAGSVRNWIVICTPTYELKDSELPGLKQILDGIPFGIALFQLATGNIVLTNRAGDFIRDEQVQFTDVEGRQAPNPLGCLGRRENLPESGLAIQGPDDLRWVRFHCDRAESGEGICVLVMEDITAQKQLEAELARKETQAHRANQDMQQFAYAASHDLQEPLRMVSGYTQLLSRRYSGKLDEDAEEYIQFISEGAQRIDRLVKDLLSLSRAGDPSTRRLETVAMASAVQYALLTLDAQIKESGAVVTQGELPSVEGDQSRLALVFQNLIGNAVKFRGAEPPRIHISASREGSHWQFCVADNGIGFESKYAGRIFGLFKRLHGREYPGTGIGLAVAKKIVEMHNGRIWAEPGQGEGSRFYFTLPVE